MTIQTSQISFDRSVYVNEKGAKEAPAATPAEALSQEEETASKTEEETATKKSDSPTSYLDDPALRQMVSELQARDSEVRAHEAAHIAAGGGIVRGGASFSYQKGPDNKLYAIGGEVPIDASTESTPEATIAKMQQVRSAAMAPSNPSSTDYKVAANAMMAEMQARGELMAQQAEEAKAQQEQGGEPTVRIDVKG